MTVTQQLHQTVFLHLFTSLQVLNRNTNRHGK